MNILAAIDDPNLFGPWFREPTSWASWRAFLAALFGLPMTPDQARIYRECTGRSDVPAEGFKEVWLPCGRRGGKSFVLALIATFLATFFDWRRYLSPGERGYIVIIAADRKQARVIMG